MISHDHALQVGKKLPGNIKPNGIPYQKGEAFVKEPEYALYVYTGEGWEKTTKNYELLDMDTQNHGLQVGDWVDSVFEKTSVAPIGVVVFVDGSYFRVQLFGHWRTTEIYDFPEGSSLYLQGNGVPGIAETDAYIGIRTGDGMIIRSAAGGGGGSIDITPLETRITANETGIATNLSNLGNHQAELSNHAQRLSTIETFFEEDPDKGLIIKGSKFIDSMVASELFSTDTSGGGTSAGGRRTEVNFSQDVAAGTNIELMPGAYSSYAVTGDEPYIPDSTALARSPFIRVVLGPLDVDRETLTYVDGFTIRFDIDIVASTKIVIFS